MSGVLDNPSYLAQFNHPSAGPQGKLSPLIYSALHLFFCTGAIVAAMPAGSFVGSLAVSKLADTLGRKRTIILSGWIWVIGAIIQCASVNRGMLVAGRVVAGLSVGLASATVPLYQSEITAPSIRGRMVSMQQWSITWGM